MRPSRSVVWRSLLALSLAIPLATQSISGSGHAATRNADPPSAPVGSLEPQGGGLSAADVARLSQNADRHVIILLKDQYANLSGASRPARQVRASAVSSDQSPILNELAQVEVTVVVGDTAGLIALEEGELAPSDAASRLAASTWRGPGMMRSGTTDCTAGSCERWATSAAETVAATALMMVKERTFRAWTCASSFRMGLWSEDTALARTWRAGRLAPLRLAY